LEVEGFWIHLDADVLDDEVMPAVDYRMPGGLPPDELAGVRRSTMPIAPRRGSSWTRSPPSLAERRVDLSCWPTSPARTRFKTSPTTRGTQCRA
jgi:hypothetical protein